MTDNRERSAVVERVYDGDTVFLTLDLLLFKVANQSCRLAGLNCIELGDTGGYETRDFVKGILTAGKKVNVKIVRMDKYAGRFDGIIEVDGMNLNDRLVSLGWALPWNGQGAAPVPAWPIVQPSTPMGASLVWHGRQIG